MNLEKLNKVLADQPKYRSKQAYQAIFEHLISSWDEATNLPAELRAVLAKAVPLEIPAEILESKNGHTFKALITLEDGEKIEAVLMRHTDGRNTVCVSCQVGCPMGCDFCATGKLGLKRSLSAEEIVEQVLVFARRLKKEKERISNVVFMGMGEPMLNYVAVMKAVKMLNDKEGMNIGARKISISTCGVIPGIDKLAGEKLQVNLALSLHAPNDDLRGRFMPVNRQYPLENVLKAVAAYIRKTKRKVMIEYILLKGVNDSVENAKELARVLTKKLGDTFMVNLIMYNETGNKYKTVDYEAKTAFREALVKEGIEVTQRFRLGHDIEGACGQLAGKSRKGWA